MSDLNREEVRHFLIAFFIILGSLTPLFSYTDINENIKANVTWSAGNGPYVINGNIRIEGYYSNGGFYNSTLTIKAGVVIKFKCNFSLEEVSSGSIVIQAASSNPIYFTSFKNDTVDEDTNGDGAGNTAAPGDWGNVWILRDGNTIHGCVFKYGDQYDWNVLPIADYSLTVRDCQFYLSVFFSLP